MTTIPCPRCGEPATVAELGEAAMQAGDVVLRIAGLAEATCPRGHVTRLPHDATAEVRRAVDEQLLRTDRRGVVRRREVCGDCAAELVLPPTRTERAVPVDVAGRVLTIVVGAPMVRCPDCAREQLPASVGEVLPALVDATVEAAGGA